MIEKLKLTIKKLRQEQFGQSSEHGVLLDQLEQQLADLEEDGAGRDCGVDGVAGKTTVASLSAASRRLSAQNTTRIRSFLVCDSEVSH